jgi:hypothetical protein
VVAEFIRNSDPLVMHSHQQCTTIGATPYGDLVVAVMMDAGLLADISVALSTPWRGDQVALNQSLPIPPCPGACGATALCPPVQGPMSVGVATTDMTCSAEEGGGGDNGSMVCSWKGCPAVVRKTYTTCQLCASEGERVFLPDSWFHPPDTRWMRRAGDAGSRLQ